MLKPNEFLTDLALSYQIELDCIAENEPTEECEEAKQVYRDLLAAAKECLAIVERSEIHDTKTDPATKFDADERNDLLIQFNSGKWSIFSWNNAVSSNGSFMPRWTSASNGE